MRVDITDLQISLKVVCECGHSCILHLGRCYHHECDCDLFEAIDWVTDFCTIPKELNTSILNLENSYDQESPSRRD